MGKRILLLGAGKIGKAIAALASQTHDVTIFDVSRDNLFSLRNTGITRAYTEGAMTEVLASSDVVICALTSTEVLAHTRLAAAHNVPFIDLNHLDEIVTEQKHIS